MDTAGLPFSIVAFAALSPVHIDFVLWVRALLASVFFPDPSVLKEIVCFGPSVAQQGAWASCSLVCSGPCPVAPGQRWAGQWGVHISHLDIHASQRQGL